MSKYIRLPRRATEPKEQQPPSAEYIPPRPWHELKAGRWINSLEASQDLGFSRRHINRLIEAGELIGSKGKVWANSIPAYNERRILAIQQKNGLSLSQLPARK